MFDFFVAICRGFGGGKFSVKRGWLQVVRVVGIGRGAAMSSWAMLATRYKPGHVRAFFGQSGSHIRRFKSDLLDVAAVMAD